MAARKPKATSAVSSAESGSRSERLQKVLAQCGLGSRRGCEELIEQGRVQIDRKVVTVLGTRVDLASQEIRVDGVVVRPERRIYYLLNKPPGVLSTNKDPQGRQRVIDIISSKERLFTVGRLDRMSEGLILVTNDGALANRLAHPRYGVTKTYRVRVAGSPTRETLEQVRRGVYLDDGKANVEALRVKNRKAGCTEMEMVLSEGRNREIRRVLARIGHKVLTLKRIAFGPLRLGKLLPGEYRTLTRSEVRELEKVAAAPVQRQENKSSPRPRGGSSGRATRSSKRLSGPSSTRTGPSRGRGKASSRGRNAPRRGRNSRR